MLTQLRTLLNAVLSEVTRLAANADRVQNRNYYESDAAIKLVV